MSKKLKVVGICLLAVCLFSLCTARIAEALDSPERINTIVDKLDNKLGDILNTAEENKVKLSNKLANLQTKFDNGDITRRRFCKKLNKLMNSRRKDNQGLFKGSVKARTKYDKKITRAVNKAEQNLKDLNTHGTNLPQGLKDAIETAKGMGDDAHDDKHTLYDTLDTAIDNAKKVPSPSCT